jgi:hypothetical protein
MDAQSTKLQRALLLRHFLDRLLDSELVSRQAEARVTLAQILAALTIPGFVISALLINKYASLAAESSSLAYLAALNDKCRFLYFSMVVMGFVTVVEWDALFPDRRDFLILSPLPVSSRTLFTAKVQSLLLFLLLFSAFVNLIPAILFPFIAAGGSIIFLFRFAFSHVMCVLAGNTFVFLSLIAIQGLLMNLFSPGAFRRISRLVQLLLLIFLLTVFFVMPGIAFTQLRQNPRALAVFPPAWFLGLYETLLRGRTVEFAGLTRQALEGLALAGFGFALTYLASYRRHLRRTLEGERIGAREKARWRESLGSLAQRIAFQNPGERAVFNFVRRTLFDSEKHRVCLGAYFGVGMAFVAMGVITVFARSGYGAVHELRGEFLSIPLVLGFFTLVGMRVVFAFPSQLGANWIFRLTEQKDKQPYLTGVHRAMVAFGVLPILATVAPFCIWAWGWRTACLHVSFVFVLMLLLMEVLLIRLDKIPFTCTYLPGKANLKLMFLPYIFAFTTYAYTMTSLELRLLRRPALMAGFIAAGSFLLAASVLRRRRKLRERSSFVYEMSPLPVAEPLSLSRWG